MVRSVASGGKFYRLLPDKENTGAYLRGGLCRGFMVTMILRAHSDWQQGMTVCMGVQECNTVAGFIQKIATILKDFSRTTFDFQGPPSRNVISQIVQNSKFPVHADRTLRPELFASPHSLFACLKLIINSCTRQKRFM